VIEVTAFFGLKLHYSNIPQEKGPKTETAMYQLRKNVLRIRRATAVAILFGSVAWLGLLIGAEVAQSPEAWHIASAWSAAPHHPQG
jgi:hypothetical protein